ncbi:MAG: dephospho-CoA kinase [Clostridia bacterium]|nr:dephospho-CoA kinase [Clostridia bacterium]
MKKVIAITGGIGSGKSLAAKFLKENGYKVVSCDEITDSLYKKHRVKKLLSKIFPSAAKGKLFIKIDKKAVAKEVFSDSEKRNRLNALMHPLIVDYAIRKARRGNGKISFVEIPLLFETQSQEKFDGIIIIKRPIENRIAAVVKRSKITEEEVVQRIGTQFEYETADLSAYTVIENDGDKENLKKAVLTAIEKF